MRFVVGRCRRRDLGLRLGRGDDVGLVEELLQDHFAVDQNQVWFQNAQERWEDKSVQVDFDFIDHQLVAVASDGR